ncbi:MAG: ribosome-binding factor A [Parcubacteria group bacterium Athens1014_10]|nr:MAG: ribosome-binding factor A [Parcubacteria group bacterium Athens1014_10]TSD04698.1 MAG: ribosome-binding factor A [Parcubacteria group bacterium Athens0714_12]
MSQRILRINSLIQQEISKILAKELEIPDGSMLTVIRAETTPDLREVKIWLSIFPFEKKKKILQNLKKNKGKIQFLLNKKLTTHPLPKINFEIDDTEKEAEKIDELLNKIDQKLETEFTNLK